MKVPILCYYPFNRSMTGGPRTVLALLRHVMDSELLPIFASQRESELTESVRALGVSVEVLPLPPVLDVLDGRALKYSLRERVASVRALSAYSRDVEAVMREHKIRGVWARGSKGVLLVAGAARRLGLPVIWDIGHEPVSEGVARFAHWYCLLSATAIVTQARVQATQLFGDRLVRACAGKFHSIVPGVEPELATRLAEAASTYAPDPQRVRLLSVGTIHPRKNQLMLLRVVAALRAEGTSVVARIAGPVGNPEYLDELTRFARANAIEDAVELLGWRDDVPELLRQTDILAITSHGEGVPHVVREAMHAGVPVVGTKVGGMEEVVRHGITGYLVEPDDVDGLHRAICKLKAASHRAEMRSASLLVARERLTAAAWATEYGSLLRRVVPASGAHVELPKSVLQSN